VCVTVAFAGGFLGAPVSFVSRSAGVWGRPRKKKETEGALWGAVAPLIGVGLGLSWVGSALVVPISRSGQRGALAGVVFRRP